MKANVIIWIRDIVCAEEIEKVLISSDYDVEEIDSECEYFNLDKNYDFAIIGKDVYQAMSEITQMSDWIKDIVDYSPWPVFFITDFEDDEEEIEVYRAGAKGYIGKNRNKKVLLVRINNLIKRNPKIDLTKKESKVFSILKNNINEYVERDYILMEIWDEKVGDKKRVVDTIIKQLRKKLSTTDYIIVSKYGYGYKLESK